MIDGITTPDGDKLDLNAYLPIVGYQIEHKETGRMLPTCTRFQLYKKTAAIIKLMDVVEIFGVNILDYRLTPIYEHEVDTGYVIIEHVLDQKGE